MLPSLGAGHFYPYLFSSLNFLHSTKFCQQLHQGDSIKSKWTQCSSSTNAQNLNCTVVGQSGSNSALGFLVCSCFFFWGGRQLEWLFCQQGLNLVCSTGCNPTHSGTQEGVWVRDCNAASHCCSRCWCTFTATTPASTGSSHLLHNHPHESQLFTLPLTYVFLCAELWV